MTISATSQGLKPGVVLSTNRPANPYDGMMIYETDTNLVRIWNGTAWKTLAYSDYTSGSVIQVASTTKTDTTSATSASYVDITGMSVSITPTSTSSKVMVLVSIQGAATSNGSMYVRLMRDSTAISIGDAAGSRTRASFGSDTNATTDYAYSGSINFLDSPATTSSVTYKLQWNSGDTGGTVYLNRGSGDADNLYYGRYASSITVMEIAG